MLDPHNPSNRELVSYGLALFGVAGAVLYGAFQVSTGRAPDNGWTGKREVKECIEPGEAISGTVATGLGHTGVSSGTSCFVEDKEGRKSYYSEQVLP